MSVLRNICGRLLVVYLCALAGKDMFVVRCVVLYSYSGRNSSYCVAGIHSHTDTITLSLERVAGNHIVFFIITQTEILFYLPYLVNHKCHWT